MFFAITAIIKMYKPIIKKKKKHDKITLSAKTKLNTASMSKTSIDSDISHGEFVSVTNVLSDLKISTVCQRF